MRIIYLCLIYFMLLPHIYMLYLKYINLIQIKILIRKIVQLSESFNFFKYLKKTRYRLHHLSANQTFDNFFRRNSQDFFTVSTYFLNLDI